MFSELYDSQAITLVVFEGDSATPYVFRNQDTLSFGRRSSGQMPDIAVQSPFVSRDHGQFLRINASWFYCDKGSKNGTMLKGRVIKDGMRGRLVPVLLSHGDVLKVASSSAYDAPSCLILFLMGDCWNTWELCLKNRKKITFGNSSHHDIQLIGEDLSGTAVLRKTRDCGWLFSADFENILVNNRKSGHGVYTSYPVQTMDCIGIEGYYFVLQEDGLFCPTSSVLRINTRRNTFRSR